jgi:hypothetical protein
MVTRQKNAFNFLRVYFQADFIEKTSENTRMLARQWYTGFALVLKPLQAEHYEGNKCLK